jgi:gas vesicle protein
MKFLIGLLLGVGLGIVVGLLIAPQSGEDMRAQLNVQGIPLPAGNLSDEIRSRANAALSQGREVYSRAKDEMSGIYNRTREGSL